jgi:hypothetical protein
LLRGAGQLLDGARDFGGDPQAADDGEENAAGRNAVSDGANMLLRLHHAAARDGDGEHGEDVALVGLEWNGGGVD